MAQVEYCTAVVLVLISTASAGKTATSGPVPDPGRYPIVPAPRHLEARSGKFQLDSATRIPCCRDRRCPRFRHRGVLLDVARYFYPPEFIKQVIDLLALCKLNTLQ